MKKRMLFISMLFAAFTLSAKQAVLRGADAIAKFPERLRDSEIAHLKDASWCQLTNGVEYFYGKFDLLFDTTANDVSFYKIDYRNAQVRMKFVDNRLISGSNKQTSYTASRNNALFGINCTFPDWFAKMEGTIYRDESRPKRAKDACPADGVKNGGLAFSDDKTYEFFQTAWWKTHPNAAGYTDAFSTEAMGLYHGKQTLSGLNWGHAPYTFMGTTQDGVLYVCVVDGRSTRSQGLGYGTVHSFLIELGCYDGMCLDGGGSTTMVCRKDLMPAGMNELQHDSDNAAAKDSYYTMNHTDDNPERSVCNQLLFVAGGPLPVTLDLTSVDEPVAAEGLVYTGKGQTGVAAGLGYELLGNVATNAGVHAATAKLQKGFCWPDGSTDDLTLHWKIEKATPTIGAVTAAAITFGEALAASALIGTSVPEGGFRWAQAEVTPTIADSGVTAYDVVFEPVDDRNFVSVATTSTLTVNRLEIAVPKAKEGLVLNFCEQTGVEVADGFTLTGNTAMAAGEHVATAALTDKANTCWADGEGSTSDRQILWSIAPATFAVVGEAEAGTDYNGSVVAFDVTNLDIGSHASDELAASFEVNGKSYVGTVTATGEADCRITFMIDAAGENAVVASNSYSGAFSLWLENEGVRTDVATVVQPLLQGTLATDTNGWFHETADGLGQTGLWTRGGEPTNPTVEHDRIVIAQTGNTPLSFAPVKSMAEHTKGVVEVVLLYEGPSDEVDEAPTEGIQCAVRVIEDRLTEKPKLQVYAALPDAGGGWKVGWHDWNQPGAESNSFVVGTEYTIRFVCDFEAESRELRCLVKAVDEQDYSLFFVGRLPDVAKGLSGRECIATVGFEGEGKISLLDGAYTRDYLDASLAEAGGERHATVAAAVAIGDRPVRLLHAASWKPTAADLNKSISFVGKDCLKLDLSAVGEGVDVVWRQEGDVWTLVLSAGPLEPVFIGLEMRETTVSLHLGNVKAGRLYRIVSAPMPTGPWTPKTDYAATADFTVPRDPSAPAAFYKIEIAEEM